MIRDAGPARPYEAACGQGLSVPLAARIECALKQAGSGSVGSVVLWRSCLPAATDTLIPQTESTGPPG